MMPQAMLWDLIEDRPAEPLPPHNGTPTSKAAAESVRHIVKADAAMVLEAIRQAGGRGLTCDEIEVATGLIHQTASARISEASRLGLIFAAYDEEGKTVKRPTRSGRKALCWVAVEFAKTL